MTATTFTGAVPFDDVVAEVDSFLRPVRATMARMTARPIGSQADAHPETAIERAGRGDQAAFAEFYDEVSGVVYGTTLRVLRNPAIAEEVTQDVFLELWKLAPRYDRSKGSPKAWAATIAHRRAVDRVRSEESARARDEVDARERAVDHDVVVEAVTAEADRSAVETALLQLSDTQREAVTLAFYGGHTYREVASILDVPEGTIKTRIRDGLSKLRVVMGPAS